MPRRHVAYINCPSLFDSGSSSWTYYITLRYSRSTTHVRTMYMHVTYVKRVVTSLERKVTNLWREVHFTRASATRWIKLKFLKMKPADEAFNRTIKCWWIFVSDNWTAWHRSMYNSHYLISYSLHGHNLILAGSPLLRGSTIRAFVLDYSLGRYNFDSRLHRLYRSSLKQETRSPDCPFSRSRFTLLEWPRCTLTADRKRRFHSSFEPRHFPRI